MPQHDRATLGSAATAAGHLSSRVLSGSDATVTLGDLAHGSILGGRCDEIRGRSVLVATASQLTAALALLELDGVARRLILYPPDLPLEHVPFVIASAGVDAVVSDRTASEFDTAGLVIPCSSKIEPMDCDRTARLRTEWIL